MNKQNLIPLKGFNYLKLLLFIPIIRGTVLLCWISISMANNICNCHRN